MVPWRKPALQDGGDERLMAQQDIILLFVQLAVMLAVALAFGQAFRALRMPIVMGEIVGGIVLGPTLVGSLAPGLFHALFPGNTGGSLGREGVARLGLLLFLFVAGLEVDLDDVGRRGKSIVFASLLGIIVPFLLGYSLVISAPEFWGPPATAAPMLLALFIGTALSISALPVIARILIDRDLMRLEVGSVVMAAATLNDLLGWALFAAILSGAGASVGGGSLWASLATIAALLALTLTVGRWAGHHALNWLDAHFSPTTVIAAAAVPVLLAGAATEALGIHSVFGAFLVGVALSESAYERSRVHETVYQFVVSLMAPIYFVSVGMQANFVANFDPLLVITVVVVACIGKIAGAGLGARLGGMSRHQALAVGFGLNARGAIEIIMASVALEHRLIDERLFVALVVMAVVTSLLSGPAMERLVVRQPAPTPGLVGEAVALPEEG